MKLRGSAITMQCPRCSTEMDCKDAWLKDFSKDELERLDPREKWDRKIEYSFYCDECNMNVVSESYIIHDKNYKTES
jgi:hypothetical protein